MSEKTVNTALTIAGSDSGGGAGIQADLKTFQENSVFGTSVITCVTAQNPNNVTGISALEKDIIQKQMIAVLDYFSVGAIKTGIATINATIVAGTPSSTIITLFRVPSNNTVAIPTEIWNKERRSNCPRGKSVLAASENGRSFLVKLKPI